MLAASSHYISPFPRILNNLIATAPRSSAPSPWWEWWVWRWRRCWWWRGPGSAPAPPCSARRSAAGAPPTGAPTSPRSAHSDTPCSTVQYSTVQYSTVTPLQGVTSHPSHCAHRPAAAAQSNIASKLSGRRRLFLRTMTRWSAIQYFY